jgi:RNA polymerase sigma-70 factor (ECF subfamily)
MAEPDRHAAQWLAAARAGSPEALGQALEACRGYLLRIAGRELGSELRPKGGASDLVQETLLEAFRDFARFEGDGEDELRQWLRRLLLNNLADFTRQYRDTAKRQVEREVPLQPGSSSSGQTGWLVAAVPSPSGDAMAHEQAEAVGRALERLPQEYRQVLVWRYRDERSLGEIADLLGLTLKAARGLLARAVRRMQQELEGPS